MRHLFHLLSTLLLILFFGQAQANIHSPSQMLDKASEAVVNIMVLEKPPLPSTPPKERRAFSEIGSGVIVNGKHGLIITNDHLLNHYAAIIVTLKSGRRYHAKLIGRDKNFDLAVIAIHATHLPILPLANSSQVHVGDRVYAIGSPFGLRQTVTSGVISAINRTQINHTGRAQSYIQTDTPINMGNSGGALVDSEGKLIGINTAIITPNKGNIGIGFAIPSNTAKAAAKQLIKFGKIKKGTLGVTLQTLDTDLASALHIKAKRGALVSFVMPKTPAEKGGLKALDVVTAANDWAIDTSTDLSDLMGLTAPGDSVKFSVVRGDKHKTLTVTAGSRKALAGIPSLPFLSGMQLEDSSALSPTSTKVRAGVRLIGALPSSQGGIAGLVPGDLILEANNRQIHNLRTLIRVAKSADKRMLLKVERAGRVVYLVISKNR